MTDEAEASAIAGGAISIRVQHIEQLFHTLDPFPFAERDLDAQAEEYIVGFARELPRSATLRIDIHVPAEAAASREAQEVGAAIAHYFAGRAEATQRELRELFRIGRRAAVVGVVVLAFCLTIDRLLLPRLGWDDIRFVSESVIILGWVANWKPLEIFLYDWWPLVRRRRLYRRLAAAKVALRPDVGQRKG